MKHRFEGENCSVARALEIVGDWRTLLVVREAFFGTRRFADFEEHLQIAKNVLAQRLAHLVEHGVMARVDAGVHGKRYEYELTAMGKDLATVMTALRQWGDRWIFGEGKEPLLVLDRRTGRPLPRLRMLDEEGEKIATADLEVRPGPGASQRTVARMAAARAANAAGGAGAGRVAGAGSKARKGTAAGRAAAAGSKARKGTAAGKKSRGK